MQTQDSFEISENDYTPAPYEPPAKKIYPQLKPNMTAKGVVTEVQKVAVADKTSNLQLIVTLAPVTSDNKPGQPTQRRYIDIPVPNPNKPGHEFTLKAFGKELTGEEAKKEAFKQGASFVRAFEPEAVPEYPFHKDDSGAGQWVDENGEPADNEAMTAATTARRKAVLAKLKEWYTNPAALTGATCFFVTGAPSGPDNKVYIKYLNSTDRGETVETENFTQE